MKHKRFLALFMAFCFIFTPINVFADETIAQTQEAQSQAPAAPASMPYGYIPLRNAALVTGAGLKFEDGIAYLTSHGDVYTFENGSSKGSFNGAGLNYSSPAIIIENTLYVNYDDVKFLFEDYGESYAYIKKYAVTLAYYYMEIYKIPSMSMSFVDAKNDYTWAQTFGYKDMENGLTPTVNTVYNLASISKTFTAMAVMQLVEQGKLDLDEKITTYIPEFKIKNHPVYGGSYRDITLRMLLAHVSGLPGDNFSSFYSENHYDKDYMNSFIEYLAEDYMDNIPLSEFSYANNGYTLLGIIVSKVMGYESNYDGFVKYTNDYIFKPMGMTNTSFVINRNDMASSYFDSSNEKTHDLLVNAAPAGGLYSSASDMARFMKFMLNHGSYGGKTVLKTTSVISMANPALEYTKLMEGNSLEMGLGMYNVKVGERTFAGHGGNVAYANSGYYLHYDSGLGVFATSNSATGIMTESFAAAVLNEAVTAATGKANPISAPVKPYIVEADKELLEELAGFYKTIGKITVSEDSRLFIEAYGIYLDYCGGSYFYNENFGKIEFKEVNGVLSMILVDSNGLIYSQRLDPEPAKGIISDFLGTYVPITKSEDERPIVTFVTFYIDANGYAQFVFGTENGQSAPSPISLIDRNMYYVIGTGRNYGKIIEFKSGAGMKYVTVFGQEFMRVSK